MRTTNRTRSKMSKAALLTGAIVLGGLTASPAFATDHSSSSSSSSSSSVAERPASSSSSSSSTPPVTPKPTTSSSTVAEEESSSSSSSSSSTPTTATTVAPTTTTTTAATTTSSTEPKLLVQPVTGSVTPKNDSANTGQDVGVQVKDVAITADPGNRLPATGADTRPLLVLGGAFVVIGGLLLAARRRMPTLAAVRSNRPSR